MKLSLEKTSQVPNICAKFFGHAGAAEGLQEISWVSWIVSRFGKWWDHTFTNLDAISVLMQRCVRVENSRGTNTLNKEGKTLKTKI